MNGCSLQKKADRWYVVFHHAGKQVWRTTHMADRAAAARVAQLIREAFIAEYYRAKVAPLPAPLPPPVATVGQIVAAYRAANKRCNGDVERRNVLRFLGFVRLLTGCASGAEGAQSSALLTRANAERWQAKCQGIDGSPDLSTRAPRNRTINSAWAAICGVFARQARQSPAMAALSLPPTLDEFLSTPALPVPRTGWKPWPADAYARMRAEGDRIADPELRMAHRLLRGLGLRAGELKAATTEWIVPMSGGRWGLAVQDYPSQAPHPFQVKGASARILPLPADVVDECLTRRAEGGYLIRGQRDYRVFRGKVEIAMPLVDEEHVRFLRQFCPPGIQKPNHELRKWVGAIIYSRQGVEAARKFLGHSDVRTVIEHYADYLGELQVDQLWQAVG